MTQTAPPAFPMGTSSVELLDELETLIGGSRRLPFSANVVINEDEALELVDRARLGLPQEIVDARHTVIDRVRIIDAAKEEAGLLLSGAQDEAGALLNAARVEADRLAAEARQRAADLVAEHEIVRGARDHATALVGDAQTKAAAVRTDADAYARQVMEELEGNLNRALTTVRKGLETLPRDEAESRRRKR